MRCSSLILVIGVFRVLLVRDRQVSCSADVADDCRPRETQGLADLKRARLLAQLAKKKKPLLSLEEGANQGKSRQRRRKCRLVLSLGKRQHWSALALKGATRRGWERRSWPSSMGDLGRR